MTLSEGLKALYPRPMAVSHGERLRGALGGAIGIFVTGLICLSLSRLLGLSPWLVAPLGASAVLVFAVPASPLAQPWSVVGGNTISAICGLLTCNLIPDPLIAASLAVGIAIGTMFALRCLHPPGGAMALLVVLTHTHAPLFALFPAFTNSLLLVGMGLLYNNLTRRAYPHVAPPATARASGLLRITEADLAEALRSQGQVLDIAVADLARLLERSELHAWQRLSGRRTCGEVMTRPVWSVHFGTHLKEAWALMKTHDIKALPVVDRRHRVHGLLTHADILSAAAACGGLDALLTPTGTIHSEKPEVCGQIMSETFATANLNDSLEARMDLFSQGDKRHLLVLDDDRRLIGIISASDVMRTVYHAA
ncbi:MAG: HPP family protein [Asticcacaulis sp.]|uniref:HPP family protein n=1 Tax=Asticcacaulis sp. TaxID=1872648 RepID=UPI0039E4CCD2